MKTILHLFAVLLLLSLALPIQAHPVPDIPVRSFFEADGSVRLEVELDIRCFADDPETEPYLQHWALKQMDEAEKQAYTTKAQNYILSAVGFFLAPEGRIKPEFKWTFTSHRGEALDAIDDPVMLTGIWEAAGNEKTTGYRLEALPEGELSVLFLNHVDDTAVEKFQVLFPGEKSYELDPANPPVIERKKPQKAE